MVFFSRHERRAGRPDAQQPRLHAVVVAAGADVIGRTLAELELELLDVKVSQYGAAISAAWPCAETVVAEGDVLVLLGVPGNLELAETRILSGAEKAASRRLETDVGGAFQWPRKRYAIPVSVTDAFAAASVSPSTANCTVPVSLIPSSMVVSICRAKRPERPLADEEGPRHAGDGRGAGDTDAAAFGVPGQPPSYGFRGRRRGRAGRQVGEAYMLPEKHGLVGYRGGVPVRHRFDHCRRLPPVVAFVPPICVSAAASSPGSARNDPGSRTRRWPVAWKSTTRALAFRC